MKRALLTLAGLVLLISAACAPAVPTVDPAQVQASAVSAASTMIAETKAAIPTPTEVPPTEVPSPTPLPSPTLSLLPTIAVPTIEPTKNADSCNQLLDVAASGGKKATLKINNITKGPATITIGLGTKNAFGQCGYLSWVIPAKNSIIVNPPQTGPGPCYWSYGWVNDPKHPSTPGGAPPLCMNSSDKYTMDVDYDTIKITPP